MPNSSGCCANWFLQPGASALLVNSSDENAEAITGDLKAAAATIGVEIDVVRATDSHGIEEAFVALIRDKVHALVVDTDPFFYNRRVQLATLATRHACPQYTTCARTPKPAA